VVGENEDKKYVKATLGAKSKSALTTIEG